MKKILIVFAVLHCLLGISFVNESEAAIYKYIDKDGIVSFADNLQSIPEKYRSTALIVDGESKDDEAKPSRPVTVDKAAEEPLPEEASKPQSQGPKPLSVRLTMSAVVSLGLLLIFIVVSNQTPLKENKKVLSILRTSLIGILSFYLLVAHVKDVMGLFGTAGKAIDDVQQRQAEKGKKAAQAMKKLDGLIQETQKLEESLDAGSGEDDQKRHH